MRLLLLCSLLVGCGFEATTGGPSALPDATGGDPSDPDARLATDAAPLTPQTFIAQLISLECEQAFLCRPQYPMGMSSFDSEWGTDMDDCIRTDRQYLMRDQVADAVTAGTISFDPELAVSCLAAPGIPTSCATLFSDDYDYAATCYAALLGHVANAGACTTDWQCAVGSRCRDARCSRD